MTLSLENPRTLLAEAGDKLRSLGVVLFIGPGVSALDAPAVPVTPEDLAAFFATKTSLPRRARGNAWAAAQYIESTRFRDTVTLWMNEAFSAGAAPTAFHRWIASLPLPLVVDAWYAGEMRAALSASGRGDWAEAQGISRAGIGEDRWFRFYDAGGTPIEAGLAEAARTLLYTPHGGIAPQGNYLITDADYVEVLTEIDIQTPIPEEVRRRRTGMSFLFIGCRFHDQMLRTYARQIMKRSSDRHFAIVELDQLTRNERRFLDEQDIEIINLPLSAAIEALMR